MADAEWDGRVANRFWMPDGAATKCTTCNLQFTLFRRRHHCRFCGKIFCHACSSQTMDGRALGMDGFVRVCDDCKLLELQMQGRGGFGSSTDDAARSAMADGLARDGATGAARMGGPGGAQTDGDGTGDGSATDRGESSSASGDDGTGSNAGRALPSSTAAAQQSAGGSGSIHAAGASGTKRKAVRDAALYGGIGVFDDKVRLSAPETPLFNRPAHAASEDILRSIAGAADEHLRRTVCRLVTLLFPDLAAPDSSANAIQQASLASTDAQSSLPDPSASLSVAQHSWANALLRLARRSVAAIDPNIPAGNRPDARLYIKIKSIPDFVGTDANESVDTENGMAECDDDSPSSVSTPTKGSSTTASSSGPHASSRVGACEIVAGVVFRRNVPHTGMRTDVVDPRIVLLDDALQFEGGGNVKMSHLGTLIEQERKYTELLVGRILSLRPDVLLVARSVSRLAQELLLRGGVSVISHVKLAALQRVSRCSGARILPSINYLDKLPAADIVGTTAGRFIVRTVPVPIAMPAYGSPAPSALRSQFASLQQSSMYTPQGAVGVLSASKSWLGYASMSTPGNNSSSAVNGSGAMTPLHWDANATPKLMKTTSSSYSISTPSARRARVTYVVVEGCPEHLGCTVVLRGHASDLARAKRILRHAIYVAWNLRLQTAYYFDAFERVVSFGGPLSIAPLFGDTGTASNDDSINQIPFVDGMMPAGVVAALPSMNLQQRLCVLRWMLALPSSPGLEPNGLPGMLAGGVAPGVQLRVPMPSTIAASLELLGLDESSLSSLSLPPSTLKLLLSSLDPIALSSSTTDSLIVSNTWISDGTQCSKPRVRSIRFYDAHDKSLGWFLQERCFDERATCRACKKGPSSHVLSYVHGRGRVDVTVHKLSYPMPMPAPPPSSHHHQPQPSSKSSSGSQRPPLGNNLKNNNAGPNARQMPTTHSVSSANAADDVVTWSYCSMCKRHVAPLARVSRGAWTLSFGKFLELCLYQHSTIVSGDASCGHCPHTHHIRYFGRGRTAAVFKFTRVTPLDLHVRRTMSRDEIWCKSTREAEARALAAVAHAQFTKTMAVIGVMQEVLRIGDEVGDTVAALASAPSPSTAAGAADAAATSSGAQQATRSTDVDEASRQGSQSRKSSALVDADDFDGDDAEQEEEAPEQSMSKRQLSSESAGSALSLAGRGASKSFAVPATAAAAKPPINQLSSILTSASSSVQQSIVALQKCGQDLTDVSNQIIAARDAGVAPAMQSGLHPSLVSADASCDVLGVAAHRRACVLKHANAEEKLAILQSELLRHAQVLLEVTMNVVDQAAAARGGSTGQPSTPKSDIGASFALPPHVQLSRQREELRRMLGKAISVAAAASAGRQQQKSKKQPQTSVQLPPQSNQDPSQLIRMQQRGHLSLPPGVRGTVIPVLDDVTSTAVAYSLSADLYWRKLTECVAAAWERMCAEQDEQEESGGDAVDVSSSASSAARSPMRAAIPKAVPPVTPLLTNAPSVTSVPAAVPLVASAASMPAVASASATSQQPPRSTAAGGGDDEEEDAVDDVDAEVEDEEDEVEEEEEEEEVDYDDYDGDVGGADVGAEVKTTSSAGATTAAASASITIPDRNTRNHGQAAGGSDKAASSPSHQPQHSQAQPTPSSPSLPSPAAAMSPLAMSLPAALSAPLASLSSFFMRPQSKPASSSAAFESIVGANGSSAAASVELSHVPSMRNIVVRSSSSEDNTSSASLRVAAPTPTPSPDALALVGTDASASSRAAIAESASPAVKLLTDAPADTTSTPASNRDMKTATVRGRRHSLATPDRVVPSLRVRAADAGHAVMQQVNAVSAAVLPSWAHTPSAGDLHALQDALKSAASAAARAPLSFLPAQDEVELAEAASQRAIGPMSPVPQPSSSSSRSGGRRSSIDFGIFSRTSPRREDQINRSGSSKPALDASGRTSSASGLDGSASARFAAMSPVTISAEQIRADTDSRGNTNAAASSAGAMASATAVLSFPAPLPPNGDRNASANPFGRHDSGGGGAHPTHHKRRSSTHGSASHLDIDSGLPGALAGAPTSVAPAPDLGVPLAMSPADMLRSDVKSDIVHSFADRTGSVPASFTVTSFWAMHFYAMRQLYLDSERSFVQSLAHSERWDATGGKSGARFERSLDGRLVSKYLSKTEFDMFITHIAPSYFQHMCGTLVDGQPSMLVKILGVYKVQVHLHSTNSGSGGAGGPTASAATVTSGAAGSIASAGAAVVSNVVASGTSSSSRKSTHYVLVMEDLFHNCIIPHGLKFDLKGKVRAQKKLPGHPAHAQSGTGSKGGAPAPNATSITASGAASASTPSASVSATPSPSPGPARSVPGTPSVQPLAVPGSGVAMRASSALMAHQNHMLTHQLPSPGRKPSGSATPVPTGEAYNPFNVDEGSRNTPSSVNPVAVGGARKGSDADGILLDPLAQQQPSSRSTSVDRPSVLDTGSSSATLPSPADDAKPAPAAVQSSSEPQPQVGLRSASSSASLAAAASSASAPLQLNPAASPPPGAAVTDPLVSPPPRTPGVPPVNSGKPSNNQGSNCSNMNSSLVLLDADLLFHTKGFPVPLTPQAKQSLDTALRRDTAFLSSVSVVDYSILLGLDMGMLGGSVYGDHGNSVGGGNGNTGVGHSPQQQVPMTVMVRHTTIQGVHQPAAAVGIIDYLRRFDIVKRLENRVKTAAQAVTNIEPTVINPERYMERLLKASDRYFMQVPDRWSAHANLDAAFPGISAAIGGSGSGESSSSHWATAAAGLSSSVAADGLASDHWRPR